MNRNLQITRAILLPLLLWPWTANGEDRKLAAKDESPAHLRLAMADPPDHPDLPNVLIIGDSISIGYTVAVRKLLDGKADVFRAKANCAYSGNGVSNVKKWVGSDRRWDVIHFNFGIWDTHYLHKGQLVRTSQLKDYKREDLTLRYTTEQYIENLKKILAVLQQTDAQLIWATTTPVTQWPEVQRVAHREKNQAARALMTNEAVTVNDLYELALPNLKTWQSGDGCHFTALGSTELARQIAASISAALEKTVDPTGEVSPCGSFDCKNQLLRSRD